MTRECFITSIQDTDLCCLHGGGRALLGVLALVLAGGLGAALRTAVDDRLSVLVHLQLDDAHLILEEKLVMQDFSTCLTTNWTLLAQ